MSTIDEVLAAAEVVDAVCVIDGETRIISVPAEYKELGVESDEKVTRVKFQCPKNVGDNIDLTEYNLYINYRNAGNKLNSYLVEDVTVTGDTINFSWLLSRHVTESPGTISYIVCAKKSDDTGVINEWNTKVATGIVGIGLEATEEIEEQNIDAIEQILRSIVELENKVDGGGSGGSSIAIDETLTEQGKAADAKATGDTIRSLSEEIITTSESKVAAHNTGTDTHSDIRLLIQGLTDRLNALADSDDTTLDQLSEVVAYIKSNRSLIEAITTGKVSVADIVDNLTTNVSNKPLSAAQGVVIKTLIDALRNDKLDAAELTNAINTALAQAKASGEFDGADGKSAYQYAVEGGYTGTEAEFAEKLAQEKFANPNALTFTGAATGTYDGSAPLSVEIPYGGGSVGSVSANIEKVYSWTADGTVQTNLDSLAIEPNKIYFCELIVPSDGSMSAGSVDTPNVYVRIGTTGNTYTGSIVGSVKGQSKFINLSSKYTFFVDSGIIHIILDRTHFSQNVPVLSNYTKDQVYIYSATSGTAILAGTTVNIYKMG